MLAKDRAGTAPQLHYSRFSSTLRWQWRLLPSSPGLHQTHPRSYFCSFSFFMLVLSTHILGIWVNLKSLSLVHLLSNSSSASWNLQLRSSFKQLLFPPKWEQIQVSQAVCMEQLHQCFCHCCCLLPFPTPGMCFWCQSVPASGRAATEIQVSVLQSARWNSCISRVHPSVGLTSALR